jgi:hypothetical protein
MTSTWRRRGTKHATLEVEAGSQTVHDCSLKAACWEVSQMRTRALIGTIVLVGLLSVACATASVEGNGSGGGASPSSTVGVTVTVGPDQSGSTVPLAVGQTLVFQPSGAVATSGLLGWRVLSYPKSLVGFTADKGRPPFRFHAEHTGTGKLQVTFGPLCGALGPNEGASVECPLAQGGSGTGAGPAGIATRVYTYDLTVVAAQGA